MKVCYKCEKEKELNEFSQNKNKKDGLNSECKECQKEYFRNYYKNNKEKHVKRVEKTISYKKNFIAALKVESGCVRCGYNKSPGALHFHHVDPTTKVMNISGNLHHDLDSLLEEIEKCEIICANCHAEEHYKYDWEKRIILKETKRRVSNHKILKNNNKSTKIYLDPKIEKKKIDWPPKEILEKLVWERPSEEIAKELNVSGSMLSRKCKQLGIEKPARGYWQKLNK